MPPALFRHIDNASMNRILRAANGNLLTIQRQGARCGAGNAEQRLAKLRTPCADQPVKPEDFALAQIRNVAEFGIVAVAFDRERGLADVDGLLGKGILHIASHHQPHDFVLWCLLEVTRTDHLAITKNRVAFGDLIDLIEFVADEEDGLALPLKVFHDAEQIVDFLARKGGCRLVHDDDTGFHRQGTGNRRKWRCAMERSFNRMVGSILLSRRSSKARDLSLMVFQSISPKRPFGAWPRKMFSPTESSSNNTVS